MTLPAQAFDARAAATALAELRAIAPLVHCLTNQVVSNFTANVLLAAGAAPAMVVAEEEAGDFAALASALLVNVGTLDRPQAAAMRAAVGAASTAGTPWVLDPVAVGALAWRTAFCRELLAFSPAVIRGNASEIIALAGGAGTGRGVDSTAQSDAALEAARALARQCGALVVVTGATDYLVDAQSARGIAGGTPRLQQVTGTGCALSALVAAACGCGAVRLDAVAAVCALMKLAGERAALASRGPGSFAVALLDELGTLASADLAERWCA
ncbi:hydroxyethylthiazole kinase [Crenobacter caeni]|uniref:Hydroxyethylthiazole kinase n=1 Tax=Crenobacter caeni TaxID=2705474 RepID=A0A6B2KSG7_9NEIS|nr:hydroxyethylthiazole kinase [Crenobacter caeni]NDV13064.1 hydroxyethylthiazole kinase [Crenobacter caeni]